MDNNIFEMCYASLYAVCDLLNIEYAYSDDKNIELLKFLLYPSKKYDNLINNCDFVKHDYDTSSIKRIMLLIVASRAYIRSLYDIERNIELEESNLVIDSLMNKNSMEVVELLIEDQDLASVVISKFFDYSFGLYVEKCIAKELVFKKAELNTIVAINPFEILDLYDYIPSNQFTKTERVLQKIFDYYNTSLYLIPTGLDDEESVITLFLDFIISDKDNTNLLKYLVSNVYEILSTMSDSVKKENKELLEFIENHDINYLINTIMNDYKFAKRIIDLFIGINDSLSDQELLLRRQNFKNMNCNLKVLKRLNPYYTDDGYGYSDIKRD